MWIVLKRIAAFALPALTLFVCVWVSRVFLAVDIVGLFYPAGGIKAVALVAALSGLLPAVPLGIAFGLMQPKASAALAVALGASAVELASASVAVAWWSFLTWWVLPLECAVLIVFFSGLASVGARLLPRLRSAVRFRIGLVGFALVTLAAVTWPWLHGCIQFSSCGNMV